MIKMTNDNRMLRSCVFSVLAGVLAIYAISRTQACYRLTAKLYGGVGEEASSTRVDDRYKSDVEQSDAVAVCRQSLVIHPVLEQLEKVTIEWLSEQTKKPESLLWTQTDHNKPLTLIVVPEKNKWLLAAAAPIAAKMRRQNTTPVLLALASENVPEQTRLIEQLTPLVRSCVLLMTEPDLPFRLPGLKTAKSIVPVTSEPAKTGLLLAETFWKKVDLVVMARLQNAEAVVLASTLASHLGVPFIPVTGRENPETLSQGLKALGVQRLLLAASNAEFDAELVGFLKPDVETLGIAEIQKRIVRVIGPENIRNLVLFRVPDEFADDTVLSWLVPYLSLMRGSAVVPCYSPDPLTAEHNVDKLIRTCLIKPQTVTILGGYDSIATIDVENTSETGDYESIAEPCSRAVKDAAASMGVGRIPLRDLWAASTLIARGIAGDYMLGQTGPKVLMIANPSNNYGSLPLCETMSRAAAAEFKNFSIHTDEFYGVPCHNQDIRTMAEYARLIIFEGHISDFTLFKNPDVFADEEFLYGSEYDDNTDDFVERDRFIYDPCDDDFHTNGDETIPSEDSPGSRRPNEKEYSWKNGKSDNQELSEQTPQPLNPLQLEAAPFIILQSCHSLEDPILEILASGSVGILGSGTNIHSASGSAFVKAFCDSLLYRGSSVGEALRDARNYLLCVGLLKTERGHKEQTKVKRVAYSFHLWGDPEVRLFHGLPKQPNLQPVSAKFVEPDKILISVPKKRLPTVRTKEYFLRLFPAGEVAGIVARLKNREERRVMPIYFFRIPMPESRELLQRTRLRELNDTTTRAVFLADPWERFLYVLYFPEKDRMGQNFTLRFVN